MLVRARAKRIEESLGSQECLPSALSCPCFGEGPCPGLLSSSLVPFQASLYLTLWSIGPEQGEAKPPRGGAAQTVQTRKSSIFPGVGTVLLNPRGTLISQVNGALMGGSLKSP